MTHIKTTQKSKKSASKIQPSVETIECDSAAIESPCEDSIRELAYAKWQAADCPEGDGVEFWLAAESELATPQHAIEAA
ncbi:MAG TPA: DUF2934 domain-containing protein [Planctomycetaceae bacterium]|nr:DUF2934 domain-containing protein [Planctomycetaceae bacterium]